MAETLLRKRVACAAFRLAKAAVRDYLAQLRREHRHIVVKNPINAAWAAEKLDMGERSVRSWWNTDLLEGNFEDSRKGHSGPKRKLSGDDLDFVRSKTKKRKESTRRISLELAERGTSVSQSTVNRALRNSLGCKPFRRIRRAWLSETNIQHRLELCESLDEWKESDCMHLAPSDEFFLYAMRKPNQKNDIIWAENREDVWDLLVAPETRHPVCVGVFLCFTSKGLCYVIKDEGQSWDGEYFRETVLKENVLPFLKDRRNREGSFEDVTFLHDMAGCMRAKLTHELLDNENLDFFRFSGYGRWPGKSPDMNPAESVGAIMQERVERALLDVEPKDIDRDLLVETTTEILEDLKTDRNLFKNLLCSFRRRLDLVKAAGGKNIGKY